MYFKYLSISHEKMQTRFLNFKVIFIVKVKNNAHPIGI